MKKKEIAGTTEYFKDAVYLTSPTRAGSPQQLMPITVATFNLSTFPVGGNRSTRREPTTFRRALTCALLT